MPLEHKMLKVIAAKGTKKVRQCTSSTKTQITVLACASTSGQTIPPMVVFAGKHFNSVLAKGEVPATLYGMSSSGWMDQELFANWFRHHFLEHAVKSLYNQMCVEDPFRKSGHICSCGGRQNITLLLNDI